MIKGAFSSLALIFKHEKRNCFRLNGVHSHEMKTVLIKDVCKKRFKYVYAVR